MKILYSWLKDYVDFDQSPEQLANDLSMFAHEVESLQKIVGDAILDLEITPNRGDCLSILGIARQVAAMYDKKIKNQNAKIKINENDIDKKIDVKILDPKICPRYTARIIDNITISPSPKWMRERLASYGFRPINNIVDVTNYVMVATGQPLHAFDYDKINDGVMNIRLSKMGEEVMTLDGKSHQLPGNAVIIEDKENIYDLAGIMGGYKSEVDEKTKTIVLEGAIFDPVLIRRASKYLHHQTDASYRYERGVDYEGTVTGVDLAASLIKETSPYAKIGGLTDIKSIKFENKTIAYTDEKVNHLIGTQLSSDEIKSALERLYFKVNNNNADVPTFRAHDVSIWQDLAEEVARIYGYNNIKRIPPYDGSSKENKDWLKRESIKDSLKNLGFSEIYSDSFANKDKITLLGENLNNCVEIINPISPETQYLRPNLMSSLLAAVAKNPWSPEINIFEIEKVFSKQNEKWQLGIATVGKNDNLIKKSIDFIGDNAEIINIDQKVLDVYKIRRPISVAIMDLDKINTQIGSINYKVSNNHYRPISKFPPTIFDLAFVVDTKIKSSEIEKTILEASSGVLFSENFDEFVSDKFGQDKKNVAYHIWLQSMTGPVDDKEIKKVRENIIKIIEKKFNAKLRS